MGDMTRRLRQTQTTICENWQRPIVADIRDASAMDLVALGEMFAGVDIASLSGRLLYPPAFSRARALACLSARLSDLLNPEISAAKDRVAALGAAMASDRLGTLRALKCRAQARYDDAVRALAIWDNRSEAA